LLPISDDQSHYKGRGYSPNVPEEEEAEALKEKAMGEVATRHHEKK
jgi:hypothetical protein